MHVHTNIYFCLFHFFFFNVWKMIKDPLLHILCLFINICNHCFCLYLEVFPGEHQWFSPSCLYTPHSTIIIVKTSFKVGWHINSNEHFKNIKWKSIFFLSNRSYNIYYISSKLYQNPYFQSLYWHIHNWQINCIRVWLR